MKSPASIALALATLLGTACAPDRCDTPFGQGAIVDVNRADFGILRTVGGTADVNRGHRGIMVRCESLGTYLAFEMACPLDHEARLVPDEPDFALLLTCPVCHSSFDLIGGNPTSHSAAQCPLYQYNTSFDGNYITIW